MNKDRQIEKIIEDNLPAIRSGLETVDSILDKYPQDSSTLRTELEAVSWLIAAREPLEARPGFIAASRKSLEQRISSMPPHTAWQRLFNRYTPQRWVFNVVAPVIILALIALVINSLVLSARLSIPGDPFYSTKLAIEDIQLAFTLNQEHKTDLYIHFSRERTTEFVELVLNGDYQYLPAAAARMESEIIASLHSLNNLAALETKEEIPMVNKLRETLSSEITLLDMLRSTSPSSARPGIDLAIQAAQLGVMALH